MSQRPRRPSARRPRGYLSGDGAGGPDGRAVGGSRRAGGRTGSGLARPHPFRLDRGDREHAGRCSSRLGPALRSRREVASNRAFCSCGSQDGHPAMSVATCHTVLMAPVMTASSPNEYIGESLYQIVKVRQSASACRRHRLPRPVRWPHYRLAGGMLFRAKAVAFYSPRHGDTSTTVGGTRSCRAAWSARHPVKVEVAGSNPVRTAGIPGEASLGSQPGQVAQLV